MKNSPVSIFTLRQRARSSAHVSWVVRYEVATRERKRQTEREREAERQRDRETERQTSDLTYLVSKPWGSPRRQESVRAAWPPTETSQSLRGKSKDHQSLGQGTTCILPCPSLGGTQLTWLRGFALGVLFLDLFPLPLYASGASWAPVQKEGSTGHQRDRKELVGGLFLGEFSKPSGEAPGHTVFANLALQPTSTGLVTVTGVYFHCHLWALSSTWSELDFRSWRGLLRALPQLSLADFNPLSGTGTSLRNTPEHQGLLLRGLGRSLVWHTSQSPCKFPTNLR